jgi:hypothetical protein
VYLDPPLTTILHFDLVPGTPKDPKNRLNTHPFHGLALSWSDPGFIMPCQLISCCQHPSQPIYLNPLSPGLVRVFSLERSQERQGRRCRPSSRHRAVPPTTLAAGVHEFVQVAK